jgi:subtilisin family serine protease
VARPPLTGLPAVLTGSVALPALLLSGLLSGLVLVSASPAHAAGTAAQPTWHADQARIPDARDAGRHGEGVVVAVLDSWVDAGHKDFEGRVLAGADCAGGSCEPGPAGQDQCDHGTHVAGTVASSSFGAAPRATVLPVRVLRYDASSGDCVGKPENVAAGIRWAVRSGARVLNLSLGPDVPGLSASSAIPAAVREAAQAGAVVVFSAGNASLPMADSYGGDAIIVAATGPNGQLASYSQRGAGVDVAAPGGDPRTPDICSQEDCVTSLFPGNRYSVAAGTSMAAPHVSGIAALLLAQDPGRSREDVLDRMLSTARPLADAGRGLIDGRAALGATSSSSPPPTRARATRAPEPVSAPSSPAVRQQPAPSPVQATHPASPSTAAAASLPPLPPGTPEASVAAVPPPQAAARPPAPPVTPAPQRVPVWTVAVATALVVGSAAATGVAARHGLRRV